MKVFSIHIVGLSNKRHEFEYEFGHEFLAEYKEDLVSAAALHATVVLDKHETFVEVDFTIRGTATLVCDRSLETFEHPVKIDKKIVFKYGDEAAELSDEVVVIPRDIATLGLGQYVYEFIALGLPMKRLHPKFGAEDDDDAIDGKLIYTSSTDNSAGEDAVDPRWEQLKKLK